MTELTPVLASVQYVPKLVLLVWCFPSDSTDDERHHWTLINLPRKPLLTLKLQQQGSVWLFALSSCPACRCRMYWLCVCVHEPFDPSKYRCCSVRFIYHGVYRRHYSDHSFIAVGIRNPIQLDMLYTGIPGMLFRWCDLLPRVVLNQFADSAGVVSTVAARIHTYLIYTTAAAELDRWQSALSMQQLVDCAPFSHHQVRRFSYSTVLE